MTSDTQFEMMELMLEARADEPIELPPKLAPMHRSHSAKAATGHVLLAVFGACLVAVALALVPLPKSASAATGFASAVYAR